jgi:hypothetical protein
MTAALLTVGQRFELRRHFHIIAQTLLQDFDRGTDDALVFVARFACH